MKEYYIENLAKELDFIDFFMVKSIQCRKDKNGKDYYDILFGDKTGEMSGKKWNVQENEIALLSAIKEHDIVKVKAQVTDFNGQLQMHILKIRQAQESDEICRDDYIKTAPRDSAHMLQEIEDKVESFMDPDYKKLCKAIIDQNREKLIYYPAAQKNHHSYYGGLLYHVTTMLKGAEAFCKIYDLNRDLLITGIILHDMEKINEMDAGTDGIATAYSFRGQMLGHLMQGIINIDEISKELGIPEEKYIMVEHMVLSHHYEPEFGSPKKPLFPEAEICHYLDVIDARMYDMSNALATTEPGEFSDKVWTLDNRKIYKRTDYVNAQQNHESEEEKE